ncbi:unnamed protein product [Rotaria sordida]|uniref:Hemoglobinase n=1 Tax=Rotaria sordida TaxID=392033 RepID=A0A815GR68_9BILA|nr:unnamed protein product [Rotaria sordida]
MVQPQTIDDCGLRHFSPLCQKKVIFWIYSHGIPDSNIVVFMYDDIANNPQNPTKGVIINHPNGKDVYHGVPKDYTGNNVTPKNFINVLLGNKEEMRGIGSEKVLESGPDDNVFVFFTDHGAVGLVAFPTGVLYAKDLNETIAKMHAQQKYKQMVIYIEACESGSMLEGLLPANINVYGTTASSAEEPSYACYYDAKRGTYLGDVYSVAWMEDSDAEQINKESLLTQYQVAKKNTNTSHVMQYGDLNLGKSHNVSEFQGAGTQPMKPIRNPFTDRYNDLLKRDAVATVDVRVSTVVHRLDNSESAVEKAALKRELVQLLNDRSTISEHIYQIASVALSIKHGHFYETVTQKRMKLTQHDCYKSVTQYIHTKCFDLQNEYVLNKLWITANLCEIVSAVESLIANDKNKLLN